MKYNELILLGTVVLGYVKIKAGQPCFLINCPDRILIILKEEGQLTRKFIMKEDIIDLKFSGRIAMGNELEEINKIASEQKSLLNDITVNKEKLKINLELEKYELTVSNKVVFETIIEFKNNHPELNLETVKLIIKSYNNNEDFGNNFKI